MGLWGAPRGDGMLTRGEAIANEEPPRGDGSARPVGAPLQGTATISLSRCAALTKRAMHHPACSCRGACACSHLLAAFCPAPP